MTKRRKPRSGHGKNTEPIKAPTRRLVGTVLPPPLYKRVKSCADAEYISLSAYCRRLLYNVVPE